MCKTYYLSTTDFLQNSFKILTLSRNVLPLSALSNGRVNAVNTPLNGYTSFRPGQRVRGCERIFRHAEVENKLSSTSRKSLNNLSNRRRFIVFGLNEIILYFYFYFSFHIFLSTPNQFHAFGDWSTDILVGTVVRSSATSVSITPHSSFIDELLSYVTFHSLFFFQTPK